MTKLLKVLVVFLLILSIAALALGVMLFMKRELLKGRTQKLERALTALAATIEAEPATVETPPRYPRKDVSPTTSELLDDPERSAFWDDYRHALELTDRETMDLQTRQKQQQLMMYYKLAPDTGKPERDLQGNKLTTGPGTMQELLNDVLGKAEEQLNRLNETRLQLTTVREELVRTVEELNALKQSHRQSLKTIVDLEAEIVRLNNEIASLNQKIAQLEAEKRSLEDQIADQLRQIAQLEEEKLTLEQEVEALREENEKLRQVEAKPGAQPTALGAGVISARVDPGVKGQVAAVEPQWNFVVVALSDAFLAELLQDPEAGIPQLELTVRRPRPDDTFVTKLRLIQVQKAEKLGICDILPDWQQKPVKKGDVVLY